MAEHFFLFQEYQKLKQMFAEHREEVKRLKATEKVFKTILYQDTIPWSFSAFRFGTSTGSKHSEKFSPHKIIPIYTDSTHFKIGYGINVILCRPKTVV